MLSFQMGWSPASGSSRFPPIPLDFQRIRQGTHVAAFLVMPDGDEIEVKDGMILGRVKSCEIHISDTKASRRHARMISQGSVVEIEDLESSNGTKLNGKDITRRMLRDGDVILIGKTSITYTEHAVAGAPPAAAPEFAGGDDLFGEDESPIEEPPAPKVEVHQPPESAPAPDVQADEEVLEFADDDVVVVKRTIPDRSKPVQKRVPPPQPSGREGGVLQFQKIPDKSGFIGLDIGQMSGLQRLGMVLIATVVAGLLFYAAMVLASGS